MKQKTLGQMVVFSASLFLAPFAAAEIYQWTDEHGQVHFTDEPPPNTSENIEKVELEITQPSAQPDEGEIRRLQLLETARRQTEHDEALKSAQQPAPVAAPTPSGDTAECVPARHRWYALNQDMPVYWTDKGTIRGRWLDDTYSGEREYISDDERSRLLAVTVKQLERACANGDSDEDDGSGYQEWLRADDCLVDKQKFEQALAPRSRSTKQKIRDLEARVRKNCD